MNRTLAGILAFAVALGAAVVVTRHYAPRPAPNPPAAPPAPPPPAPVAETPPVPAAGAPIVFHKAQLITLDLAARQSHTTLALERDPARPAPEKLWVRTYLFTKDGSAGYKVCGGDPVEVRRPFANESRPVVTVNAPAATCPAPSGPAATYYARVNVSAESGAAAQLSMLPADYDITKGVPVVLQEGARKPR